MSATVIGFGIFVFLMSFLLIRREVFASDDILRIFILELIVIGTLFTVAAGFSSKDIAPAMVLFGTIAGYILASYGDKGKKGEDR